MGKMTEHIIERAVERNQPLNSDSLNNIFVNLTAKASIFSSLVCNKICSQSIHSLLYSSVEGNQPFSQSLTFQNDMFSHNIYMDCNINIHSKLESGAICHQCNIFLQLNYYILFSHVVKRKLSAYISFYTLSSHFGRT